MTRREQVGTHSRATTHPIAPSSDRATNPGGILALGVGRKKVTTVRPNVCTVRSTLALYVA